MPETIRFGASISTSGRYALQGGQALAGLQAWAKATNVERGVRISQLGGTLPIALIHYDDAGSSERAVAAAEKLIQVDRVHVLIGPYGSALTQAVVGVARGHGRLLWNHGGASDDIHRPAHGVVSIVIPASRYFGGLFELVRSLDARGGSGWPSDLYPSTPGGFQCNTLNVQDPGSFITPVRRFGTSPGHPDFSARWDLVPGSTFGATINLVDVAETITGATGYPPMFSGQRAFERVCPYLP